MKSKRSRLVVKEEGSKSPTKKRRESSGTSAKSQTKERHKQTTDSNEKSTQIDCGGGKQRSSQEDVVFHISKFLCSRSTEANVRETSTEDNKQSGKREPDVNSVMFLVQHLESGMPEGDYMSDVSVTNEDLATLLLPWSIARLMRASSDTSIDIYKDGDNTADEKNDVLWRTLSCCLDILSGQKVFNEAKTTFATEIVLSNSLSQSTLSKLLPFAASVAFNKMGSNNHASNAFSHLIKRYRPSVEVACTSLLQHIEQLVLKTNATFNKIGLPRHQYQVVSNVLESMHTLLAGANPKRSFGVLVNEEVLVRLGRLGSIRMNERDGLSTNATNDVIDVEGAVDVEEMANSSLEKILNDGLFHLVHHMDGFRTMAELRTMPSLPNDFNDDGESSVEITTKISGSKVCYQNGLFKSLRMLLSPNGHGGGVENKDIMAVLHLLPILIRGFFNRIQNKQSSTGPTMTEAEAKLQFYFWAQATLPSIKLLSLTEASSELEVALLKMTADALKLVLNYDAYSPSYSDSDGTLVSFLHFVTDAILRCIKKNSDLLPLDDQRTMHLVASLKTLLLLNHRLIHERLSTCIAFACLTMRQYNNETQAVGDASALLSAIVKTYSELRQIGHFILSSRNAFSDITNLESMHSLVSCKQVINLLGETYFSIPSGQLHEIWDFFDSWVSEVTDEDANIPQAELLFAIDMFIVFTKSIRTDKHNASELRRLCEKSMTSGSVGKLLKNVDSVGTNDASVRQGIELCGWLVDLHTRSCFWIDSIAVDESGSASLLGQSSDNNSLNVLSYLRDVAAEIVESKHFKQWKAAWQNPTEHKKSQPRIELLSSLSPPLLRLALHRIHQLHSMIYYCKIQEEEQDNGVVDVAVQLSSAALRNEAKTLVDFSIYTASVQGRQQVAGSIDTETLWLSVAQSLRTWSCYAEDLHLRVFLNWFFSTLCHIDASAINDKECVLALIRDASFYDVKECTSLLMPEGLKFALTKVMNLMKQPSSKHLVAKLKELIVSDAKGIADSCQSLLSAVSLEDNSASSIKEVSSVLSFLASAPLDLSLCTANINLIDKLLGLDILMSKMYEIDNALVETSGPVLMKIVCTVRSVLASLLPKALVVGDVPLLMSAADHLIENSCVAEAYSEALWAAGNLMAELFSIGIDYHEKDCSILLGLSEKISNLLSNKTNTASPKKFMPSAYIIRSIIRRMNILQHHHHSFSSKNNELYQIGAQITNVSIKQISRSIIECINLRELDVEHSKAAAISILLASELFSFLSLEANDVVDTKENIKEIFDLVVGITSAPNPDVRSAVHYFLSSVLTNKKFIHMCNCSVNGFERVLHEMEVAYLDNVETPLLEAALSSLLRDAKLDDIQFIISYLPPRHGGTRHDTAFAVKVYHLLICCIKSQEQIKFLARHSIRILMTSMSLLRDGQGQDSERAIVSNSVLFSSMMSSLVARKELLLLSGREIAMICCEMSSIFHKNKSFAGMMDEVTLFKSCCVVVSSLVSHYPKQLYGCPSPLFGLLLALLSHILHSSIKEGLAQKALEYSKICELLNPHKAQFKKHVVGLILRYIHALNSGLSSTTKSKLMPTIYGLLDMCSEFEFRQVNSMIDVPSKALFAPVFQSFRKYYQYHGQA